MNDQNKVQQSAALKICQDFGMELISPSETDYLAVLKSVLVNRLSDLIQYDNEKLKWILYRIDVSEKKVLTLLAENPLQEALEGIADLIIERQIEKAISRQQHSSGEADLEMDIEY
ncbi:MAG: hypothetical protein SFW35_11710 [Chitinophagales bacterium]|nr:hypothetical protein [Chitinophagales bacterium]